MYGRGARAPSIQIQLFVQMGGLPRVSLFWGNTNWLRYLIPIIYFDRKRTLDRKRTQFPPKAFFFGLQFGTKTPFNFRLWLFFFWFSPTFRHNFQ